MPESVQSCFDVLSKKNNRDKAYSSVYKQVKLLDNGFSFTVVDQLQKAIPIN